MTLRYGMVGGGPGAFIGPVHRMAAALDGEWRLCAGAFSADGEKSRRTGRASGAGDGSRIRVLAGDGTHRGRTPRGRAHPRGGDRHPEPPAPSGSARVSGARHPRRLRQTARGVGGGGRRPVPPGCLDRPRLRGDLQLFRLPAGKGGARAGARRRDRPGAEGGGRVLAGVAGGVARGRRTQAGRSGGPIRGAGGHLPCWGTSGLTHTT